MKSRDQSPSMACRFLKVEEDPMQETVHAVDAMTTKTPEEAAS
jgi:hypothetical protein